MDLSPGFLLHNRYKIIRLLGQGGMGAVYLANDQSLANEVAVKVNRSSSPKAAAQFIAEARLLATLRHPNLPRVIDYFQDEGMGQFLVMDYITGDDLKSLLENNQVPPVDQVLTWAVQLGAALSYLHRQNPPVFHRDVKPANLKLSAQHEIILVDFGIAKAAASSTDTSTGASLLSPGYAPPEQYGVGHTGAYSDQYAMGATFYQLLTGHLPADAFQRLMGKATLTPAQAYNAAVPAHVDQALQRAMALRVEDRFPSVDDFVYALTHPGANLSYGATTPAGVYPPTLASGYPSAAQTPSQPVYPSTMASGYPPPAQAGYPSQSQPTFPPSQPPYPPAGQPTYPPSQPPYPPPAQPTYPPSQPPYPPSTGPGYGQGQSPYPANQAGGYPPPTAVPAAKRFPWMWVGIIAVVLVFACGGLMYIATNGAAPEPSATPRATILPATPTKKNDPLTATVPATITATAKPPSPTAPAATGTRAATSTRPPLSTATAMAGGTVLQNPASFAVKYLTFFHSRTNGFSDQLWNVKLSAGAKLTSQDGILSVLGGVEAISTKLDFSNDIRVYLGGGTYGIGLKDFTLFVQRSSDGTSYLRMTCSDQAKGAAMRLTCEWYQLIAGKETRLENTSADLCSNACDIEVELDSGTYRVYANKDLKITFKNAQLTTGAIGLRINNPSSTPYKLDTISVYKIPKTSSVGGYLLMDDLGETWPVGHSDSEFATIDRSITSKIYKWVVKSKQSVNMRVGPTPDFVLPDRFIMFVDVQQVSGPEDACYGMIYQFQDDNNYYLFCITDSGTLSVFAKQNGNWTTLVDHEIAIDINAGEVNTLKVVGDGSQYSFYVNDLDTPVTEITDDRFTGGTIGLSGELYAAGQQVEWDYTQVQVNQLGQ